MSTVIVVVGYRCEIVIDILAMDGLSSSPGARRRRKRRTSAVPGCYDVKRW